MVEDEDQCPSDRNLLAGGSDSEGPVGQHHQFLGREQVVFEPDLPQASSRTLPSPRPRYSEPDRPRANTARQRRHARGPREDASPPPRPSNSPKKHRLRMADLHVLCLVCHDALFRSRPDALRPPFAGLRKPPWDRPMLSPDTPNCNPPSAENQTASESEKQT